MKPFAFAVILLCASAICHAQGTKKADPDIRSMRAQQERLSVTHGKIVEMIEKGDDRDLATSVLLGQVDDVISAALWELIWLKEDPLSGCADNPKLLLHYKTRIAAQQQTLKIVIRLQIGGSPIVRGLALDLTEEVVKATAAIDRLLKKRPQEF